MPSNESPLSVSNSQRSNENSGQGSNTGNSGQIVSEGVHSKIVKVIEEHSIAYSITAETKKENDKRKILVVDDEPDVLTLLTKVLRRMVNSHDDPILALEN